ncbi:ATPase [Halobacteriales archaeon QS_4_69_31]|nr:MAG: ATPase [Halobacteriales archaeon QS_4_69_31]
MTDSDTDTRLSGRQKSTAEDADAARDVVTSVVDNVEQVIVGHHDEVEHILTALLGRGHVLLEDVPGVGKTMLARSVAQSFDGTFKRVQFTPDLLPSDVTGVNVYNQKTETFEFRPGPVFANVVLGDEINRAPPKTQSALLEAMEERQVSVDGDTHEVPQPYTVIATQNTVERDRTYQLPMAELDRFMKKLRLGYPERGEETDMLDRVVGSHPIETLSPVVTLENFRKARETAAGVTVDESVRDYVTRLAQYTRRHAELGASPRGTIAALRAAQGRAILDGREYVIPDDIQTEATVVFPHRIRTESAESTPRAIVDEALEAVPVE